MRAAPPKAVAIRDAAEALAGEGVTTAQDPAVLSRDENAWISVVAQRSGLTWHYVQMLAGTPGVKPDRMMTRFVADSLSLPRHKVTPAFALDIVKRRVAADMEIYASDLDHGIWQCQRRER